MGISPASAYSANAVLYGYGSGRTSVPGSKDNDSKPSQEDQSKVTELERRDQEVRAHEAAHAAAGGQYVRGGATFQYQKGPDGKMYAVGGEVSIDTSPVKDNPQATISKMETVKRAALAPASPSGQDRSVASAASAAEAQARQELTQKNAAAGAKGSAKAPDKASTSPHTHSYNQKGIAATFSPAATATLWGVA